MTELPPVAADPPVTGHPVIDAALAGMELSGSPAEQAVQVQRVLEVLQGVLNPPAA